MGPQYELQAEDIRAYTLKLLKDHVKLEVAGYVCTTDVIPEVLLKAGADHFQHDRTRDAQVLRHAAGDRPTTLVDLRRGDVTARDARLGLAGRGAGSHSGRAVHKRLGRTRRGSHRVRHSAGACGGGPGSSADPH